MPLEILSSYFPFRLKVLGADVVSEDQARDLCRTVTRVLKTLMEKRDMTVNEVRSTN